MGIICIFSSKYEKLWFCLKCKNIRCLLSLSRRALISPPILRIYSLLSFPIYFSIFRYTKPSKNEARTNYFKIFADFCNFSSRKRLFCLGIIKVWGKTIYGMWIPYIIHHFEYKCTFILQSQLEILAILEKPSNIPVILKKMATQNLDIRILDPDFLFRGI